MKKALFAFLIMFTMLGLTGCPGKDDDDCKQNIAGCDSSDYSCDEAENCYETKSGCSASDEC